MRENIRVWITQVCTCGLNNTIGNARGCMQYIVYRIHKQRTKTNGMYAREVRIPLLQGNSLKLALLARGCLLIFDQYI